MDLRGEINRIRIGDQHIHGLDQVDWEEVLGTYPTENSNPI